jgi:hypothetical protein
LLILGSSEHFLAALNIGRISRGLLGVCVCADTVHDIGKRWLIPQHDEAYRGTDMGPAHSVQ